MGVSIAASLFGCCATLPTKSGTWQGLARPLVVYGPDGKGMDTVRILVAPNDVPDLTPSGLYSNFDPAKLPEATREDWQLRRRSPFLVTLDSIPIALDGIREGDVLRVRGTWGSPHVRTKRGLMVNERVDGQRLEPVTVGIKCKRIENLTRRTSVPLRGADFEP